MCVVRGKGKGCREMGRDGEEEGPNKSRSLTRSQITGSDKSRKASIGVVKITHVYSMDILVCSVSF